MWQALTETNRPNIGDECYGCSNAKTTSGVLIDNPTLIHCQCDPKTGAARDSWPTAIFDMSKSFVSILW